MKNVVHADGVDRKSVFQVPDDAPPDRFSAGVLLGPPDLSALGLGEETTTRLHNELFARGIIRRVDARNNRDQVYAALMFALQIDAERIVLLYEESANLERGT